MSNKNSKKKNAINSFSLKLIIFSIQSFSSICNNIEIDIEHN